MKILIVASILIVATTNLGCHIKSENYAMHDKYGSFASHCLGRSSVRIPIAFSETAVATGIFKPASAPAEVGSFNVVVEDTKKSKKIFSNHILEQRGSFKNNESATTDVLRLDSKLSNTATLFRIQEIETAYRSELHFLIGESLVIVKIDSYNNSYLTAEDGLVKFMASFKVGDQENTHGFCLGTVAIHGDFVKESGSYYFRDDAGNTFDIKIDSFKPGYPRSLLTRVSSADSLLSLFHIGHTVLRSGERFVAGMRAQEWLGWTNLGPDGDEKTFKFTTETMHLAKRGKTTPLIQITFDSAQPLDNGTYPKTNMSDDEAMAVWDLVISSIQPKK